MGEPTCRRCSQCPNSQHHWMEDILSSLLEDEEREVHEADDPEFLPGDDQPIWTCKHCDHWQPIRLCEVCGEFLDPETGACVECDEVDDG